MQYQATARYNGVNYTGPLAGDDDSAVIGVLALLPADFAQRDTALIVEHVYHNARHVSYVTTASKYQLAVN